LYVKEQYIIQAVQNARQIVSSYTGCSLISAIHIFKLFF